MLAVGIVLLGSSVKLPQALLNPGGARTELNGIVAAEGAVAMAESAASSATSSLVQSAEATAITLAAAGSETDSPNLGTPDSPVATALAELSKHVRRQSHPDALRLALQAYYNYQAANPGKIRNPCFYFVDYGLDNATPRGYVFDMKALELVEGPFTVAHGRGSSRARNGAPTSFSNVPGSAATSLGLYLTQETYGFSGTAGGRRYRSIGLRMSGLSGRFNSAARQRGVVTHGAPYVTARDAGRSEGCPAMEEPRAQRLIPQIANGGLVFLFSPRDKNWMENDPWINGGVR
jgi:hypothetical protein